MGRTIDIDDEEEFESKSQKGRVIGAINTEEQIKDYKLYMFDFDLTMADTIETARQAYKKAIPACGGKYDETKLLEYLSVPLDVTYSKNCKSKTVVKFREIFYDKTHEIIAATTLLYPDTIDCLQELHIQGKKLAIVTNRDKESMEIFLKSVVINDSILLIDFFDEIICRDDVLDKQKPNPDPINICIDRIKNKFPSINIERNNCVYVGDAENDMLSAKNAGIDFIYIRRDGDNREKLNIASISSLSAITEKIKKLKTEIDKIINLFSELSKGIKNKEYIVVVGQGLTLENASYKEEVLKMFNEHQNVEAFDANTFYSACFNYAKLYGDGQLKEKLKNICPDNKEPSRCHDIISSLPFATYVSFCFDRQLSHSIRKNVAKNVKEISCYNDLQNWDFFSDTVPLFNILGSQNERLPLRFPNVNTDNSNKIILKSSDDKIISNEDSILIQLLQLIRVKKKAIYIGFDDTDYEIAAHVLDCDNNFAERILIRHTTETQIRLSIDKTQKLTTLTINQSLFLKLLYKVYSTNNLELDDLDLTPEQMPDWLYDIASNPTETQAIDLFLKRVAQELNDIKDDNSSAIILFRNKITDAFNKIYFIKSHFISLQKHYDNIVMLCDQIIATYTGDKGIVKKLKNVIDIESLMQYRKQISLKISKIAQELEPLELATSEDRRQINIGLYGMSERVMDFLNGLAKNINVDGVNLFISECVAKRTNSYNDDFFYCKGILNDRGILTNFINNENTLNVYVVSDIYLTKLIATKKIDMLCFGVHTIFVEDDAYILRNIYGTKLLMERAISAGVKVYFITEDDKFERSATSANVRFYADDREMELWGRKWKTISNERNLIKYLSTRNEEMRLVKGCHIITESEKIEVK